MLLLKTKRSNCITTKILVSASSSMTLNFVLHSVKCLILVRDHASPPFVLLPLFSNVVNPASALPKSVCVDTLSKFIKTYSTTPNCLSSNSSGLFSCEFSLYIQPPQLKATEKLVPLFPTKHYANGMSAATQKLSQSGSLSLAKLYVPPAHL